MYARLGTALLMASLVVPATAFAQESGPEDPPHDQRVEQSEVRPQAGPLSDNGATELEMGPRATEPRFGDHSIAPRAQSEFSAADDIAVLLPATARQASALMIAGGALLITGLILGDDAGTVVAVTGAALGAYGLYLYFK